jgi:hypothetical protein
MCGLTRVTCPLNCSGRGKCMLNGKCWCAPFYSGDFCENFMGCNSLNDLVCQDVISTNGLNL